MPARVGPPPNIVVVVTDDQRADSLFAMPTVVRLLGEHGITFASAVVSNPLCCPSRATLLTGAYSHTTGVYSNDGPHGGWPAFRRDGTAARTIAVALDAARYRTALIGKFMNRYGGRTVPPGWDRWAAFADGGIGGAYYDYTMFVKHGSAERTEMYGAEPEDYSTTVIREKALAFLRGGRADRPFFLVVAPFAVHEHVEPAPDDAGSFETYDPELAPSFNEEDLSDKPAYIQAREPLPRDVAVRRLRVQAEALQAVDRMIGDLVRALRSSERLRDTMFVFHLRQRAPHGRASLVRQAGPVRGVDPGSARD